VGEGGNALDAKRDDPVTLHLYDRVISARIGRQATERPIRCESDDIIDILCVVSRGVMWLYRAERQIFLVSLSVTYGTAVPVRYRQRFTTQFGGRADTVNTLAFCHYSHVIKTPK